jgi:hypothetical protein
MSQLSRDAVLREFQGASLGDARRVKRLGAIVGRLVQAPARSFPKLVRHSSELEGLYRWFSSSAFDADEVLAPHVSETKKRAADAGRIRVLHDTTGFVFKGDREELGIIEGTAMGFHAHVALAVDANEPADPLGVLGVHRFVNEPTKTKERRKLTPAQIAQVSRAMPREEKQSHRWERLAMDVSDSLPKGVQAVHVMDQDADDFVVFAALASRGLRFVIRGSENRLLVPRGATSVGDVMSAKRNTVFRTVRLEHRQKQKAGRRYEPRDERDAHLSIRWSRLTLAKPSGAQTDVAELTLNVVQVLETDPPEGGQAVSWVLVTNEPVETLEDAAAVVDHYRARWLIEEYFKALKTGCAVEKRQLTAYDGLAKALAVFMPIAWQMLRLRRAARLPKPPPADAVLAREEVQLLGALLEEETDYRLPAAPTARDVLLGLARLGGHLKRNGEPGWQTIGAGYDEFRDAWRVWSIARRKM